MSPRKGANLESLPCHSLGSVKGWQWISGVTVGSFRLILLPAVGGLLTHSHGGLSALDLGLTTGAHPFPSPLSILFDSHFPLSPWQVLVAYLVL